MIVTSTPQRKRRRVLYPLDRTNFQRILLIVFFISWRSVLYAGKPQRMKLVNEALLRAALLSRGEASNADLVADTGLSQTTVNQVLAQMLRSGIVRDAGKRASSGGRPASAWMLDPGAWAGMAIAIEPDELAWGICDALGVARDGGKRPVRSEALREAAGLALELKAAAGGGSRRCGLAVGVPGSVKDGSLVTGDFIDAWAGIDLRAEFERASGLPAVVESDLNAIALGYARTAGAGGGEARSLAYVQFSGEACAGSGLVVEGRIFRGASSFSGELGYLPMGKGRVLDDLLAEAASDELRAETIVAVLRTVNCVVNPEAIALGGRGFRFDLGPDIARGFAAAVEEEVRPSLSFVEDAAPHYLAGLSALAAELVFPALRLVDPRSAN
jgi:hypothetical protein